MAKISDLRLAYQVFMKAYPYRRVDWRPGTLLRKPLTEARVAVVTTAAYFTPDQPPFDTSIRGGDYSYRIIPLDTDLSTLLIAHRSDAFDIRGIAWDKNLALPLDRLKSLAEEGVIGSVAPHHFSFMGSIAAPGRLIANTAPEVARGLLEDAVDAVLLTPVWPMCHQSVGLIQSMIEKAGIPTASVTLLREITERVAPPRALFVDFPFGYPLGAPNDATLQTRILRSALDLLLESVPPAIIRDFDAVRWSPESSREIRKAHAEESPYEALVCWDGIRLARHTLSDSNPLSARRILGPFDSCILDEITCSRLFPMTAPCSSMTIMATKVDPTGIEPRAILHAAHFHNARVLEVGAGDGRLTFRYAEVPTSVVGIDTNESEIRSTAQGCRAELRGHVQFLCANGTALPFSAERFDIVLLASSLWWVPQQGMVDALGETRRVLTPEGTLVDVRPVTAPLVVEVIIATRAIWSVEVSSYVGAEDNAAADAAVRHALSREWFVFQKRHPFDFEIYCDTAEDLKVYAQMHRRMRTAEIPYETLEMRRRELSDGPTARLRCRRSWILSGYRKMRHDG